MRRTYSVNFVTTMALMLGLIFSAELASGRQRNELSNAAIRDALLWWSQLPKSAEFHDLSPDVNAALMQFIETSGGFHSRLRRPSDRSFEVQSAFLKKQALERTVVALFTRDGIGAEAANFADSVSPAYEWEGFSGGPLSEMAGAELYLERHPSTPIRSYAQLLIAHRSICASDALQFELKDRVGDRNGDAAQLVRVRSRFQQAIVEASQSPFLLVQFVALDLSRNPRCL